MTKFFQSAFVPLIVIALLVFLATSSGSSVPGFVGAILPFLLLIGFWVVLRKQVLSRRNPEQLPPIGASATRTAAPDEGSREVITKTASFPLPFGRRRRESSSDASALTVEGSTDTQALAKRIGLDG